MLRTISKIGYYLFFGALTLVAIVVVISAFPLEGNIQIKVVESGSMEPTIKTGSVALIKPTTAYTVGDIITFNGNFRNQKGQRVPTTHRIVEVRMEQEKPVYITKGDANEDPDSKATLHDQVIGKVYATVPYVGYAIETARTTYGFLALIIIPALIVIWDQFGKIMHEIKKMRGHESKDV